MDLHFIFKVYIIIMTALGMLITIGMVGKEREPITPTIAVGTALLAALNIIGYVAYL